jgi:hypothetical protein
MGRRFIFAPAIAAMLIIIAGGDARSQPGQSSEPAVPKVEATAVFTYLNLRDVREGPVGVGGRFGVNVNQYIALEAEATYFPQNPSGNFGETTGFFGVKAGKRFFQRFGLFGKVKPGFIRFGSPHFDLRLPKKEFFAADIGGVIEYYPNRHTVVRLDYSDVIIPFGGIDYLVSIPPRRLGTSHNFQQSLSIGVRF